MKTLMTATAALALMTTGALAYTGASEQMRGTVEGILTEAGIEVPVTTLNDQQIAEIYFIGTSGMESNMTGRIEAVLEGEGLSKMALEADEADANMVWLVREGEGSIVKSVQNYLDWKGYEVDASALTDEQVAEIYFVAFGSDDMNSKAKVDAVLGM